MVTTNARSALLAATNLHIPSKNELPRIPYHLDTWISALAHHPNQTLVQYHLQGLRNGYYHGNHSHPELRVDALFDNLSSAYQFQDFLTSNILTELNHGRYLGPFSSIDTIPSEFRPFRNSPLGVVPKKHTNPPKYRTIQHLSFPEGASINDGIDPDEFRIQYQSIHVVTDLLVTLGPTALFWKADVADAFRTIPIHRSDWAMQGICWLGLFFLDMFLPFGLRSAPFIFTSLMDLFVWACITLYNLPNLSHFVDDFIYVALLEDAFASYERFQIMAAPSAFPLNIPNSYLLLRISNTSGFSSMHLQ